MKTKSLLLFLALALLAGLLSACGTPPAATWPGLAADNGVAYLSNGAVIYAVRLSDKQQLWSFSSSTKSAFYANPVFTSDGQLLVGSSANDHALFRLDPKATSEANRVTWTFTGAKDHWIASPLVVGDMVYAPNADGTLYIFDMSITGEDKLVGTVALGGRLWAQPTTDGTLIFLTSLDHKVFAVDPQSKSKAWEITLDGAMTGSALPANGKLYVGTFGPSMNAIDIATKKVLWSTPAVLGVWSAPVLNGDTLYFGDLKGNFYALNASDGKPAAETLQPDNAIVASPILLDGRVILVAESGTVFSLETDGKLVSLETFANSKIYTAPVLASDLILVAPFQGESLLVALDKDGKQVWAFVPGK